MREGRGKGSGRKLCESTIACSLGGTTRTGLDIKHLATPNNLGGIQFG